jgi:hypothetical protein
MNLKPFLIPHISINSKQMSNLAIKAKVIKFLEGTIVVNPHDLGFGHGLLDMTPKT